MTPEPYRRTLCRVIVNRVHNNAKVVMLAAKEGAKHGPTIPLDAFPKAVADYLFETQDTFLWVMARYIDREDGGPQIDEDSWEAFPAYDGKYGSHPGHCCVEHGCKYSDPDCPIVTGEIPQYFACYDCDEVAFYQRQRNEGESYWPEDEEGVGPAGPTPLREALAALEHEQWAHWTRYMLDTIEQHMAEWPFASKQLRDLECVARWRRQIDTPYEDLSEKEKDSDREWADKVGALVAGARPNPDLPDQWVERAQALLAEIGIEVPWWVTYAPQPRTDPLVQSQSIERAVKETDADAELFKRYRDGLPGCGGARPAYVDGGIRTPVATSSSSPVTIKVDLPHGSHATSSQPRELRYPDEEAEPDPEDREAAGLAKLQDGAAPLYERERDITDYVFGDDDLDEAP